MAKKYLNKSLYVLTGKDLIDCGSDPSMYIKFENPSYGMFLNLAISEKDLFIKYAPVAVYRYEKFSLSSSNNIDPLDCKAIIKYLISIKKRKYKNVTSLVNSRTRIKNKIKMLREDFSIKELAKYIKKREKKGETVCQN